MRNRFLVIAALALFVGSPFAVAAETNAITTPGSLGLGFSLGQPMGASAKMWLSSMSAVDAGLGYHFNHNFDMHTDFLLHTYAVSNSLNVPNGDLPLYAGLGARVLVGDDSQFGLRFPFGVSYLIRPNHVELFAEIAPIVDLSNIGFDMDGTVGVRIYAF